MLQQYSLIKHLLQNIILFPYIIYCMIITNLISFNQFRAMFRTNCLINFEFISFYQL